MDKGASAADQRGRRLLLALLSTLDGMLQVDTSSFNAQTTAADVLWAAVPIVTLPGQRFVGRVGASLAAAVPQGVYVARDKADYVRLASALVSAADVGIAAGDSKRIPILRMCPFETHCCVHSHGPAARQAPLFVDASRSRLLV